MAIYQRVPDGLYTTTSSQNQKAPQNVMNGQKQSAPFGIIDSPGPYYPNKAFGDFVYTLVLRMLTNDDKTKAALDNRIRIQLDTAKNRYNGKSQSYDSLTSGNVNAQVRMAASGYDVYGKTILSGNQNVSNNQTYQNMKNKIHFGTDPQYTNRNRGSRNIF